MDGRKENNGNNSARTKKKHANKNFDLMDAHL